jgi:uncharacterized membrane protein YraQ (UPF0718 family)
MHPSQDLVARTQPRAVRISGSATGTTDRLFARVVEESILQATTAAPKGGLSAWKKAAIWSAVVLAVAALCWSLKGPQTVVLAFENYLEQLAVLLPRMSAALLIGGFAQVLVPRELVTKWLGAESGIKGIFVATLAGALTPGGPMLAFPLIILLRQAGASSTSLIAFVTAWATLGFHRVLMWELPFLGPEFALVRFLSSIPLAIVAGLTVMLCTRLMQHRRRGSS